MLDRGVSFPKETLEVEGDFRDAQANQQDTEKRDYYKPFMEGEP